MKKEKIYKLLLTGGVVFALSFGVAGCKDTSHDVGSVSSVKYSFQKKAHPLEFGHPKNDTVFKTYKTIDNYKSKMSIPCPSEWEVEKNTASEVKMSSSDKKRLPWASADFYFDYSSDTKNPSLRQLEDMFRKRYNASETTCEDGAGYIYETIKEGGDELPLSVSGNVSNDFVYQADKVQLETDDGTLIKNYYAQRTYYFSYNDTQCCAVFRAPEKYLKKLKPFADYVVGNISYIEESNKKGVMTGLEKGVLYSIPSKLSREYHPAYLFSSDSAEDKSITNLELSDAPRRFAGVSVSQFALKDKDKGKLSKESLNEEYADYLFCRGLVGDESPESYSNIYDSYYLGKESFGKYKAKHYNVDVTIIRNSSEGSPAIRFGDSWKMDVFILKKNGKEIVISLKYPATSSSDVQEIIKNIKKTIK